MAERYQNDINKIPFFRAPKKALFLARFDRNRHGLKRCPSWLWNLDKMTARKPSGAFTSPLFNSAFEGKAEPIDQRAFLAVKRHRGSLYILSASYFPRTSHCTTLSISPPIISLNPHFNPCYTHKPLHQPYKPNDRFRAQVPFDYKQRISK